MVIHHSQPCSDRRPLGASPHGAADIVRSLYWQLPDQLTAALQFSLPRSAAAAGESVPFFSLNSLLDVLTE